MGTTGVEGGSLAGQQRGQTWPDSWTENEGGIQDFPYDTKGIRVLFSRRWEKVPCGKEFADENRFGEFSSVYIGPFTPLTNPPTWPVKRVRVTATSSTVKRNPDGLA